MSRQTLVLEALRDGTVGPRTVRASCPFCHRKGHSSRKKNLELNRTNGWWSCWRCEKKGRLDGWETDPSVDLSAPVETALFDPPNGFIPIGSGPGARSILTQGSRDYAARRGLPPEAVRDAYMGQIMAKGEDQDFRGRLIIPILSADEDRSQWLGWVGRDFTGRQESYKYPMGMSRAKVLYNRACLNVQTERPALVVEGVLDVMPFWPDGVAGLGTYSEPQIEMMSLTRRPLLIALDGDAWRKAEALCLILTMQGVNAGWVKLPPKKDPDEVVQWLKYTMTREDLWSR